MRLHKPTAVPPVLHKPTVPQQKGHAVQPVGNAQQLRLMVSTCTTAHCLFHPLLKSWNTLNFWVWITATMFTSSTGKSINVINAKKKTKKNISCLWRYQRLAVDKLFLPPCTYKQVCRDTGWQTNLLSTGKSSRFQNTGTNVHSSRYSVFREWDTAWKTNTEWITVHTTHVIWASWVWETLHTSGQSCGHFQRFSLESSLPLRKCREQWGYSPPIRSKSVSGHSGDLH